MTPVVSRLRRMIPLLAFVGACRVPTTSPSTVTPPRAAESASVETPPERLPDEGTTADEPLAIPSDSDDDWLPPLPQLDLAEGGVDAAARDDCQGRYPASELAASPQKLHAVALCLADAGAIGLEVGLLTSLVLDHPDAEDYRVALIRLGLRYEQLGRHTDAIDAYLEHIRKYAAERDTLSLARRSLCLAWLSDDRRRFDQLSQVMQRYYRKKLHFEEPTDAELQALCRSATVP